jgi:hypothetical protein
MEIVDRAAIAPGICILTADSQGPFLDTGMSFNAGTIGIEGRAYLHLPFVKQMGRAVEMIEKEEHQSVLDDRDALTREVAELKEELGDRDRQIAEQEAQRLADNEKVMETIKRLKPPSPNGTKRQSRKRVLTRG